ncbi:hypothetical protein [Thermithiobacillus plumbiphilus]|uniref:Uncharacterized protein n=1 Tax=Thermithiobacillus plumbiphilus TaxID=1729899 RepID=A0ABU9DBJ3_9PROT
MIDIRMFIPSPGSAGLFCADEWQLQVPPKACIFRLPLAHICALRSKHTFCKKFQKYVFRPKTKVGKKERGAGEGPAAFLFQEPGWQGW